MRLLSHIFKRRPSNSAINAPVLSPIISTNAWSKHCTIEASTTSSGGDGNRKAFRVHSFPYLKGSLLFRCESTLWSVSALSLLVQVQVDPKRPVKAGLEAKDIDCTIAAKICPLPQHASQRPQSQAWSFSYLSYGSPSPASIPIHANLLVPGGSRRAALHYLQWSSGMW